MRSYYVYIMASRSRVLYVGMTNDLFRRVAEHKALQTPGFTRKYQVVRLVYFEEFAYVLNAIAREKEIKAWRRGKKLRLVEKDNPKWADLSESLGGATYRTTALNTY